MYRTIFLTFYFALFALPLQAVASVRINEVMTSNSNVLADEDGDYEDWIELFNAGDTVEPLSGYGLSDNDDQPYRWVFPDIALAPGAFLHIFASGKDRRDIGGELHTNFAIQSSGEDVILTNPAGIRVDEYTGRPLPQNIAVGRQPNGSDTWYYFDRPTPESSNLSAPFDAVVTPPEFSHPAGFYTKAIALELHTDQEEATVRYTLDGSVPTATSPAYSNPITITDRSQEPNENSNIRSGPPDDWAEWREPATTVFKATVLRAASFKGTLQSDPVTSTYFIDRAGSNRYHVPVISLATQPENLFSDDIGIYVPGLLYDGEDWHTGNYFGRGALWERPVHIEYYDEFGRHQISQNVGLRIHGGTSRRFSPKGLRLYARSSFDNDSIDYPFFGSALPQRFRSILLRASGNDFSSTMFRDALMQRLIAPLGLDQQAYSPSVLFINGEYWGIHNIRERIDADYLQSHHGVDPKNVDLLSNNQIVERGDSGHYDEMLAYLESHNLALTEHYQHIKTYMDVDNFINYMSSQLYFANTDWPNGNIEYWRARTEQYSPELPYGQDGRWRWIVFDTDYGFGFVTEGYAHNTLRRATTNAPAWSTFLLRTLLKNQEFRAQFINRQADLLNTVFQPDHVTDIIEEMRQNLAPLMDEHVARWSYPSAVGRWNNTVENELKYFAEVRPDYVRQHIIDFFSLPGLAQLTLNVDQHSGGHIRLNGMELDALTPDLQDRTVPYPWSGTYFQGVPVQIEAVPEAGFAFSHWVGLPRDTPRVTSVALRRHTHITAHFQNVSLGDGTGCFAQRIVSLRTRLQKHLGDLCLLFCTAAALIFGSTGVHQRTP